MDPNAFDTPIESGGTLSWMPLVLFCVIAVALGIGLLYLMQKRKRARRKALLSLRAISVMLPKAKEDDDHAKRDPKELIALMEPVFTAVQHHVVSKVKKAFWEGQPTFAFEIVAKHGEIFFYVFAPEEYMIQVERQIHAQFPAAHIEPANDYDIFLEPGGVSSAAAVGLQKSFIFPVRTYKGLENDPLNAITNTLSKVGNGKAAIQVVVQPASKEQYKRIEHALQNVQQGKKFEHGREGFGGKLSGLAKEVGDTAIGKEKKDGENEAHNVTKQNIRLTALQEQQSKLLVEKGSKVMLATQIRIVARAESEAEAKAQVQTMLSSFSQFNAPESNGFKAASVGDRGLITDYIFRSMSSRQPLLYLSTEELSSVFHLPCNPLSTPNIHWLGARKLAPPVNLPKSGVALGYSNFRGDAQPVYIQYPDRMRHLYMIGKTGVGKTVLFQNMVLQDIRNGYGVCYLDPNGDAIEWILKHIPKERIDDVILIDPADTGRPLALNLLEYDAQYPEQKTMVINEMISIFDKLYDLKSTGGPIFEQYMRNAMLLIMDDPASGSTLMEISRVLADPDFRNYKLSKSTNQVVIDFWTKEAEKAGGEAALANMVPYITSKLTQFTSNDIMRPMIGQQESSFNFRKAMDEGKIVLVSLPKGLLGEMNAKLLGMIISGKIQIAAFSRQNVPEEQRIPFFLYVDEFQNFTSKTFATILSEARKYRLSLNITHQYIEQLDDETKGAVMGNVGTMVAWRIGVGDAEFLQKELAPVSVDDLVSSEKFSFYVRTLIDGAPTVPFNVLSYPPDPLDDAQIAAEVRQRSRTVYGKDRAEVEQIIRQRAQVVVPSPTAAQV
ncbi:MAG TPA: hypothetical protein VLA04_05050 [Verrucomicrobiae bacterium]|nr:hypothetical protein [Verrucomicrobiae bacterium]